MVKINKNLVPIKAHYFFFMAAMGPILPQLNVYGKQLGISPDVMGLILSVLPILYILAKPGVGFLADYFSKARKQIFVLIIIIMTISYTGFALIPDIKPHSININTVFNFTTISKNISECHNQVLSIESMCSITRTVNCATKTKTGVLYIMKLDESEVISNIYPEAVIIDNNSYYVCDKSIDTFINSTELEQLECLPDINRIPDCLYNTKTFWLFVILMCLGTIGFNVTNSISDAVCFDMLGESEQMKYGSQRVWGTIGFGLTALLGGIAVDLSTKDSIKSIVPALIVMLIFSGLDLISVTKLKLPKFSSADSIYKEVTALLRQVNIVIFLIFATLAGILDAFIIYFMFWHLEDVAAATGYMSSIKLIEGCVVAAECLGGEIIFFPLSGKILKKIGYVHCLSLCFLTYSLRLGLISLILNPWWLVPIELIMQGCTYALCYTCIVAYASAIAPIGTSATVQGLVAGMDDGAGFAIGSLIGGQLYKFYGGARSFQIFSIIALITCFAHIIIRPAKKHEIHENKIGYAIPMEQNIKEEQKTVD